MKCKICGHTVLAGAVVHENCVYLARQKVLEEAEQRINKIPHMGVTSTALAFRQGVAMAMNVIKDMQAGTKTAELGCEVKGGSVYGHG